MRTPTIKGFSFSYATKQDYDLAWEKFPYNRSGLDVVLGRVDDPRWRAKVKALVDVTHPYSRTIWPAMSSSQPWKVDWTWAWLELFSPKVRTSRTVGSPFFSSLCSTSENTGISHAAAVEHARRRAKLAFLGKIREEQNPFQALPFFGELRETIRMIKRPLSGIIRKNRSAARQFNAVQRLYRSKPGRLNDALERTYLQWTYGVSPLINDIQGVIDSCKRLFDEPTVKRISVTIPIADGKVDSSCSLNYLESGTQCIGFHSETTVKGSLRLVGALKHVKQPASPEKFQELFGLRARDIVPAAWELTPYSFLVDYFVNLGDVLGGVFTDTSDLVYACESVRLRQSTKGFAIPLPCDRRCVGWPVLPVSGNVDKVSLNRAIPSLLVGIRDISWRDTTVGQLINTAVLSSQALRSAAFRR